MDSLPLASTTFAERLYLEIKSCPSDLVGGGGAGCAGGTPVGGIATRGWKEGGGYIKPSFITLAIMFWKSTAKHAISGAGVATTPAGANRLTASKPRPERTLSVVAATLPPFRCRSHMISRVLNCGNIWDICSTWAGSTTFPRARPRALGGLLSSSRLKNHRNTKKETTARVRSEGMLRDGSSSDIVADRQAECRRFAITVQTLLGYR